MDVVYDYQCGNSLVSLFNMRYGICFVRFRIFLAFVRCAFFVQIDNVECSAQKIDIYTTVPYVRSIIFKGMDCCFDPRFRFKVDESYVVDHTNYFRTNKLVNFFFRGFGDYFINVIIKPVFVILWEIV